MFLSDGLVTVYILGCLKILVKLNTPFHSGWGKLGIMCIFKSKYFNVSITSQSGSNHLSLRTKN